MRLRICLTAILAVLFVLGPVGAARARYEIVTYKEHVVVNGKEVLDGDSYVEQSCNGVRAAPWIGSPPAYCSTPSAPSTPTTRSSPRCSPVPVATSAPAPTSRAWPTVRGAVDRLLTAKARWARRDCF